MAASRSVESKTFAAARRDSMTLLPVAAALSASQS